MFEVYWNFLERLLLVLNTVDTLKELNRYLGINFSMVRLSPEGVPLFMESLRDKNPVVYCTAGYRSAMVWAVLRHYDINSKNYDGSWFEYSSQKMSKPLITLKLDPRQLSRGLKAGLDSSKNDIGFEVQHDHIFGVYQFDHDGTDYTLHFKIEELQLRREKNKFQ